MTEQTQAPEQQPDGPKLRDRTVKPEGTIPKQAQTYVIVGVPILIVLAVLWSNKHAKPAAKNQRKEPTVVITEGNDRKISDFGQEMTNEQRATQKAQLEKQMQAQARSLESASVMQPGDTRQFVGPQYAGPGQSAPPPPPPAPIVQHERELTYNSRFASNFAFSTERVSAEVKGISPPQQAGVAPVWSDGISGNVPGPSSTPASGQPVEKRHASVNVNSAEGQPYVLFEGTELETALVNRLDGDFSGPVKVMVTNSIYSHDRQHVLIPEGTFALGETIKL